MSKGMTYFWPRFRKNRMFLGSYFVIHKSLLLIIIVALLSVDRWQPHLSLGMSLFLLPIAMLVGIKVPTMMHNCMHGNMKYFNDLIGEFASFFILMSFGIVCTHHTLHHTYADTKLDPHNPEGQTFWQFLSTSQFRGVRVTESKFLEFHGNTVTNIILFKCNIAMHFLGNILRLIIWYLLLGNLFFTLYLPAFFSYLFVFSHVNYITHGRDKNGLAVITNVNSNLYYRFINFVCDGVYFHKNHHMHPSAYNPQHFVRR
jgi:fatty acid desaturase